MSKEETRAELLKRQELWKARLFVGSITRMDMDYENTVLALKHVVGLMQHMGVDDPAWTHFSKTSRDLQGLASAHAVIAEDETGAVLRDHVSPVNVMWCYRGNDKIEVVEETVLYVPLITRPFNIDYELSVSGTRRLVNENLKYEHLASLQIVRL